MSQGTISQTNTEIVNRMVMECQSAGDLSLIEEFFSPDFVNHALFPGMTTDREGVRMLFSFFHEVFEGFHVEVKMHIAEGDKVFTYKTLHGTHRAEFLGVPATGKTVAIDAMDVLRVEDGKLVEHWNVVDVAGLMRQLGVM
jgi:steroid delta-isomerase-like uncharacterized protein